MAKKSVKKEEESGVGASIKQLDAYLKKNKKDHLNFEKQIDWKVSTGSLLLDVELGSGYAQGASIVVGPSYSGKSSFTAQCLKNFLETLENAKGLWVKAEGRLDNDFIERSGIKFVFSPEEWVVGTCFVYESNIFESATDLINGLVQNNPENIRYGMVIDSMDGLIRRDDFVKEAAESEKVGAAGLLTSTLFKKANLAMNKRGHALWMLKQIRATISTDKYAPKDKNASVGGGGGNAAIHSANNIYQLSPRSKSRTIEEGGKVVGHKCGVLISKGVKERTDVLVEYPVKHGRTGGNSVWLEYEIADLLVQWGLVDKAGSWLTVSNDLITELKENNIAVDDEVKVQGDAKLKDWLEENPEITKYLYNKFLKLLSV
jgi:RecA/RadA recombinase